MKLLILCSLCFKIWFNSILFCFNLSSVGIHSVKIFYVIMPISLIFVWWSPVREYHVRLWNKFSLAIYWSLWDEATHLYAPQSQPVLNWMMNIFLDFFFLLFVYFGMSLPNDLSRKPANCLVLFFLLVPCIKLIIKCWKVFPKNLSNIYPSLPISSHSLHPALFQTLISSCIYSIDAEFGGFHASRVFLWETPGDSPLMIVAPF